MPATSRARNDLQTTLLSIPAFGASTLALRPDTRVPCWHGDVQWQRLRLGELVDQVAARASAGNDQSRIRSRSVVLMVNYSVPRRWPVPGAVLSVTIARARAAIGDVVAARARAHVAFGARWHRRTPLRRTLYAEFRSTRTRARCSLGLGI